ncbi:Response regulator receiver domain-containing protein [Halogeometricum rufum]|uniref:Response regulator receiver domain-containing protein n=1 Tax=Halogeometricum rufum TaxID=553469 RepID=A0A1I6IRH3_9EURY|nr:GAF domain-containing protein [Halogeometricum rufum]SFR69334.1 Response regulator receiver domain-containing protein [Halogeometricum rufum]
MNGATVVCADSDTEARTETATALSDAGLDTVESASVADVKDELGDGVDCVVTEYDLSDGTGMDVVRAVRDSTPDVPCVLYTDERPSSFDTSQVEGMIVEYFRKSAPDAQERLGDLVSDMITQRAQVSYILPDDEEERLAALEQYEIEEFELRASFERISELVASHFGWEAAFVGTIDQNEENFLACHGIELGESADRQDTICTHAILEEQVTVIEDILADHRFVENEMLDSVGIRAYAGANIDTPDGHTIGSLCLIDYEPNTMSEQERREFALFADEVAEQLELRREILDGDN